MDEEVKLYWRNWWEENGHMVVLGGTIITATVALNAIVFQRILNRTHVEIVLKPV